MYMFLPYSLSIQGMIYLKYLDSYHIVKCLKDTLKCNWACLRNWKVISYHLTYMDDVFLLLGLSDTSIQEIMKNENYASPQQRYIYMLLLLQLK